MSYLIARINGVASHTKSTYCVGSLRRFGFFLLCIRKQFLSVTGDMLLTHLLGVLMVEGKVEAGCTLVRLREAERLELTFP